jgi:hypothetical protein
MSALQESLGLTLVIAFAAFTGTAASVPPNPARSAKAMATSEFSGQCLAQFAVDGKIPEAGSPDDLRQAWCVRGVTLRQVQGSADELNLVGFIQAEFNAKAQRRKGAKTESMSGEQQGEIWRSVIERLTVQPETVGYPSAFAPLHLCVKTLLPRDRFGVTCIRGSLARGPMRGFRLLFSPDSSAPFKRRPYP